MMLSVMLLPDAAGEFDDGSVTEMMKLVCGDDEDVADENV